MPINSTIPTKTEKSNKTSPFWLRETPYIPASPGLPFDAPSTSDFKTLHFAGTDVSNFEVSSAAFQLLAMFVMDTPDGVAFDMPSY